MAGTAGTAGPTVTAPGKGLPFPDHHSLSAVVRGCPVVWPTGCCRNKSMCPENKCILPLRWFVVSLERGTGPSKGRELKTLFLTGRICPSSTVLWLWKDSGCVSWGMPRSGVWFSLLPSFRACACSPRVCVPRSVLFNSAFVGSKAGASGLFPKLMDSHGVGSWPTAELKCLLGLPCSFLNMMQWE